MLVDATKKSSANFTPLESTRFFVKGPGFYILKAISHRLCCMSSLHDKNRWSKTIILSLFYSDVCQASTIKEGRDHQPEGGMYHFTVMYLQGFHQRCMYRSQISTRTSENFRLNPGYPGSFAFLNAEKTILRWSWKTKSVSQQLGELQLLGQSTRM